MTYFIATSWGDAPVACHFRALAAELVRRGHRVVLLVDGQRYDAEDHVNNPAVYTWPSRRPVRWQDARFLLRLIRQYSPHCLIANFGASNVMMLVGWLAGVPCRTVWYHTISKAIELDAQGAHWKIEALRWRKRLVYGAATHIVPASQAARADVGTVFQIAPDKCQVFYNSLADPLPSSIAIPARPRLVCVGRLFPTKGQEVLLRALALLKERVPHIQLELVGRGPQEAELRALAASLGIAAQCDFVGAVSHAEVLQRMRTATATVLPSRSDNNPLVVIESLALGVPVVASGVGGIVESLTDGVEGFLVPPDDPATLAARLALLLTDADLRQRMSERARARFLTQFEQTRLITAQAQWFEGLAAGATAMA
ncbi:MAG: glycosyltransferase family 4 protein [Blastocatellia bacterium]